MARPATTLFLHGGPGFSSVLERTHYGDSLPVDWWDQPRVEPGNPRPFDTLVEAAVERLRELSHGQSAGIALLANSFGTYLAWELVQRTPEAVRSVTLSGPVGDLRAGFVTLGRRLAREHSDEALEGRCRTAAGATDEASFWALAGHISSIPGFTDVYWAPGSTSWQAQTRSLAAQGRLTDGFTFSAVVQDLLVTRRDVLAPFPGKGIKVRVVLGRHEPFGEEGTAAAWQRLIPQAEVAVVEAGHFPHLERPPEEWLPD